MTDKLKDFKAWWAKYGRVRGFEDRGAGYYACRAAWKAAQKQVFDQAATGFGPDANRAKREAHAAKIAGAGEWMKAPPKLTRELCDKVSAIVAHTATGRTSSTKPNKANKPKRDTSMPTVKHNLGSQVEGLLCGEA
jgi:hypothetical protein